MPWKKYQSETPSEIELTSWWGRDSNSNIGIVLGRGVFALDLDGSSSANLLKEKGISIPISAPCSKTGKGFHFLLAGDNIPDCVGLLKSQDGKSQIDIRGVGYIVAPPSIHESGAKYEWLVPPDGKVPPAPEELLKLIKNGNKPTTERAKEGPGWVQEALSGVGEGQRDATCARLAGYFIGKKIDSSVIKIILTNIFARNCRPPFTADEVDKTVESIFRKHGITGEFDREIVPAHISDVGQEFYESLFRPAKNVPTAFSGLDEMLNGGFYPGDLIYMGARPGTGKTAMALQIARKAAEKDGVLFVSREMVNTALMRRLVAQSGRISAGSLKTSIPQGPEREKICAVLDELGKLPIWFTDEVVTIEELADMIENFKAEKPLGLVIVDHLQLMRANKALREKRMQVEAVSQGLKTLAMLYKIPVLCMSTLSRAPDKKNPRPTLDSLRESGELEHDADTVLLLHREFGAAMVDVIVAKNRDGSVGEVSLCFEPQYLYFSQLS